MINQRVNFPHMQADSAGSTARRSQHFGLELCELRHSFTRLPLLASDDFPHSRPAELLDVSTRAGDDTSMA